MRRHAQDFVCQKLASGELVNVGKQNLRVEEPEDIVEIVLFLCLDKAYFAV